jgi:DNA-binding response OmpR family regulator
MLRIDRRRPLVRIGKRAVRLTKAEYELITALGMMDNKLTPREILLEVVSDGRRSLRSDKNILLLRILRLRRKIGSDRLRCQRQIGYILLGDVQFYG